MKKQIAILASAVLNVCSRTAAVLFAVAVGSQALAATVATTLGFGVIAQSDNELGTLVSLNISTIYAALSLVFLVVFGIVMVMFAYRKIGQQQKKSM